MGIFAVTGSASGIGLATRSRVEAAGHDVVGVDLRDAEVLADLSRRSGRDEAVRGVLDACEGRLDGLVTAAGVGPPFDPQRMASINYFGSAELIAGLRDAMEATGDAQAVAVSSNSTTIVPAVPSDLVDRLLAGDEVRAHAILGELNDADPLQAMNYAYAGSKTAIARLVRRLAPTPEWAGSGIRLNAIAPGATDTPLLDAGLDNEVFGELIRSFPIPTGGFGSPDQIAAWIEMMLLSDAARFMCGSVVFVDGGSDALVRADAWPSTYGLE